MTEDDNPPFGEWLQGLLENPASGGAKGCFLWIAAAPLFLVCAVSGLAIFPGGTYPTSVLIAPGLLLGALALNVFGWICYKLPTALAVPLSLGVAAVAGYYAWLFGAGIVAMFIRAM